MAGKKSRGYFFYLYKWFLFGLLSWGLSLILLFIGLNIEAAKEPCDGCGLIYAAILLLFGFFIGIFYLIIVIIGSVISNKTQKQLPPKKALIIIFSLFLIFLFAIVGGEVISALKTKKIYSDIKNQINTIDCTDVFKKYKSSELKDFCYINKYEAIYGNTEEVCGGISLNMSKNFREADDYLIRSCTSKIASILDDPWACPMFQNKYFVSSCLTRFAIRRNDGSLCNLEKSDSVDTQCLEFVKAHSDDNVNDCLLVNASGELQSVCISEFALKDDDVSYCDLFTNDYYSKECKESYEFYSKWKIE